MGVQPLRLLAHDADDLEVIAAALEEAVASIGELEWDARGRRFTLALTRYCWEVPDALLGVRVRAGLQFGGVLAVKSRNLQREPADTVVELLTVGFQPGEPPGGDIRLAFAGGGDVMLTVECIDAVLVDVSAPWPVADAPLQDDDA
ncbi:MAG TPA: DUF2948 family protein [Caulobacteraceae bacterium]|jgi:hypothetical protein|nr:DUF2948 family protein [Caulobacteraceae bacterium]